MQNLTYGLNNLEVTDRSCFNGKGGQLKIVIGVGSRDKRRKEGETQRTFVRNLSKRQNLQLELKSKPTKNTFEYGGQYRDVCMLAEMIPQREILLQREGVRQGFLKQSPGFWTKQCNAVPKEGVGLRWGKTTRPPKNRSDNRCQVGWWMRWGTIGGSSLIVLIFLVK